MSVLLDDAIHVQKRDGWRSIVIESISERWLPPIATAISPLKEGDEFLGTLHVIVIYSFNQCDIYNNK